MAPEAGSGWGAYLLTGDAATAEELRPRGLDQGRWALRPTAQPCRRSPRTCGYPRFTFPRVTTVEKRVVLVTNWCARVSLAG